MSLLLVLSSTYPFSVLLLKILSFSNFDMARSLFGGGNAGNTEEEED